MAAYAIKVYLKKPKKSGLATKGNYFLQTDLEKNYYLMRDLSDNVVNIYTDKTKVKQMADLLQEQNPNSFITFTDDIPAAALARGLKKIGLIDNEISHISR